MKLIMPNAFNIENHSITRYSGLFDEFIRKFLLSLQNLDVAILTCDIRPKDCSGTNALSYLSQLCHLKGVL